MIIILLILAYLMVGCTVSIVLGILSGDYDFSLYTGLIWPLGIPMVAIAFIIYDIYRLLRKIIGFIRKSIEKRGDKEKKYMLRAEITIFRNKSDPVHYSEHRAKDIVSILWKNNVDVTKVTFQEENEDLSYRCYVGR